MASEMTECNVCNEKFDSGNHKPLCLTCGHTFCFSCITNLLRLPATKNCPKCRRQFSQQIIDQMIVNYALIPSENTARPHPPSSLSEAPCLHQGKALDYLCVDCMELVCFTCIRGAHKNHTIELIDDLLQEDESVLNSWTKIRAAMNDKLGRVNNLVSVSDDILSLIDAMKTEFQGRKDLLLEQKISTEQDLQAWDASATDVIENKRHECKEMLCRLKLKLKPPSNMETSEIKSRLSAALEKCVSLQTYELPVYEDGVPWTVTSRAEGERAVASLASNIKPSRLVVLSTRTHPIPELEDLLYRLCYHHADDISLLPLDYFWRPAGQSDGGMGAIINKFSDRLDTVYGSPDQVWDYFKKQPYTVMLSGATGEGTRWIGVRCDVYPWPAFVIFLVPELIDDVCCVRGTSLNFISYLKKSCYTVTRWHFPDLCDEDLDWMIDILHQFRDSRLRVVLPRNGLTATGARRLFEELPQIREVYHDPGAVHLTSAGSAPDRTFIELSTNNIMQWM